GRGVAPDTPFEDSARATQKRALLNHAPLSQARSSTSLMLPSGSYLSHRLLAPANSREQRQHEQDEASTDGVGQQVRRLQPVEGEADQRSQDTGHGRGRLIHAQHLALLG